MYHLLTKYQSALSVTLLGLVILSNFHFFRMLSRVLLYFTMHA